MIDDEICVPAGLTTDGLLGRRYLARFIDSMIILGLVGLAAIPLSTFLSVKDTRVVANSLTFFPVMLVVWIGYGTILESSKLQATVGKGLLGLRVYNAEGGRLTWTQAGGRNLLKDGPFILLGLIPGGQLLSLGWLFAHLVVIHRSPVNQAIHDRAAHSWVAAPETTTQLHLA